MKNPIATITMNNQKTMEIELFPQIAPTTVANFVSLANKGFYNGLIFHRVIPSFMIQGGCPKGNGTGNPNYTIVGEFDKSGFKNPIKHQRGVISMARSSDMNSAGSQFFIMHKDSPHLDGSYAAFGQVTKGIEVVDDIAKTPTNAMDKPLTPQVIQSITVETFGETYPQPQQAEK